MCTQTNIRKPLIGSNYFGLVTKSNEGLERVPVYMSRCSVQHSLEMIMPLHFYLCELMISSRKAIFSFFFSLQGKVYVICYDTQAVNLFKLNRMHSFRYKNYLGGFKSTTLTLGYFFTVYFFHFISTTMQKCQRNVYISLNEAEQIHC